MESQSYMAPRILCFDVAGRLIQSSEALRQSGFVVDEVLQDSLALRMADNIDYAGAVIGPNVERSVRNKVAVTVRDRNPNAIVVMLDTDSLADAELADAVLNRDTSDHELPWLLLQLLISRSSSERSHAAAD